MVQYYKTTNGGTDWIIQTSRYYDDLKSVNFLDANLGYVCGYGVIYKTT